MNLDTQKIFVALHEARKLPSTPAEDMEALISAAHAIHFIELGGHGYNFEDYLAGIQNTTAPALRTFATWEEANIWLKQDPLPPRAVTLLIGGARHSVAYCLDSGLPMPLRLPTVEELARLDGPAAQGRFGNILLALHEARDHLGAAQHREALACAEVALHYIQESGLSDDFAELLADTTSAPIPPVRSFATRDEADTWLKNHPRPPHGGWVRIGQERYSVGYWRESDRRVLLRVPAQEELKKTDGTAGGEEN
jgi:hypothetical protein